MDEYLRLMNVRICPEDPNMATLEGFHFFLRHGEIVFLLGGVWSGMAVLKGILTGDCEIAGGRLFVDGRAVAAKNFAAEPVICIDPGTHFCESLTVEENFQSILGRPAGSRQDFRRHLKRQMMELGLLCDVNTLVGVLSGMAQCLLWLVLARLKGAKLVIFDCAESSYSEQDQEGLKSAFQKLRESGCSVLILSRLPNLFMGMADRAALLRNGSVRKIFYREEIQEETVLSYLMGLEAVPRELVSAPVSMEEPESGFCGRFPIREGEILGICDVGWSLEEPMPIYMTDFFEKNGWSWPTELAPKDLAYISGESEEELFHALSIGENIALVASRIVKPRFGIVPERMNQFYLREFQNRFELGEAVSRVEDLRLFERKLLSIYRWALTRPQILFLENPLLRIPLAERTVLIEYFRSLAADGFFLVILSNTLENLKGVCDRVLLAEDKTVKRILP
ncbi:hypothetical protein [Hominifimenecus sp. rT4P-3]|uniref:hypothetical protein n=1 Tax=Hominifimenecus sp. rT4P-3 TaxID=3242979 RepID=UPI003DA2C0DC